MLLSETVEALLNRLGAGTLNESTIKGQLSLIYDQAKAQETEIEAKQAKIEHYEKCITELEVKLHKQEQAPQPDHGERLKEGAEKILQLFFGSRRWTLERAARQIGLSNGVAEYHADALVKAQMIELAGIGPSGTGYVLTPQGRAYIVKNNLA